MKKFVAAMLIFTAIVACKKNETNTETTAETPAVVHDTVTEPAGGLSDSAKTEAVQTNAMDSSDPTDTTQANPATKSPVNNPNIQK